MTGLLDDPLLIYIEEYQLDDYLDRIHRYVMCRLHDTIWHESRKQIHEDIVHSNLVSNLQWVKPEMLET